MTCSCNQVVSTLVIHWWALLLCAALHCACLGCLFLPTDVCRSWGHLAHAGIPSVPAFGMTALSIPPIRQQLAPCRLAHTAIKDLPAQSEITLSQAQHPILGLWDMHTSGTAFRVAVVHTVCGSTPNVCPIHSGTLTSGLGSASPSLQPSLHSKNCSSFMSPCPSDDMILNGILHWMFRQPSLLCSTPRQATKMTSHRCFVLFQQDFVFCSTEWLASWKTIS